MSVPMVCRQRGLPPEGGLRQERVEPLERTPPQDGPDPSGMDHGMDQTPLEGTWDQTGSDIVPPEGTWDQRQKVASYPCEQTNMSKNITFLQ